VIRHSTVEVAAESLPPSRSAGDPARGRHVEEVGEGLTELKVRVSHLVGEYRLRMGDSRRYWCPYGKNPAAFR
jgi:hypothetical protein